MIFLLTTNKKREIDKKELFFSFGKYLQQENNQFVMLDDHVDNQQVYQY
jgi:hypothetical protein